MSFLTQAKLALSVAGVGAFAWGVRADHPAARWIGIGLLATAFLLRVLNPRRPKPTDPGEAGDRGE